MVFAQPDAFLVLGELEKVIVPRKPLFRDEGHFTVGQHKLLRIREDMVTQLAKWNFERAETGGGAPIKPVVMLLHGQVELGAAEEKTLVRILMYEIQTPVAALVVPVATQDHHRYPNRTQRKRAVRGQ